MRHKRKISRYISLWCGFCVWFVYQQPGGREAWILKQGCAELSIKRVICSLRSAELPSALTSWAPPVETRWAGYEESCISSSILYWSSNRLFKSLLLDRRLARFVFAAACRHGSQNSQPWQRAAQCTASVLGSLLKYPKWFRVCLPNYCIFKISGSVSDLYSLTYRDLIALLDI